MTLDHPIDTTLALLATWGLRLLSAILILVAGWLIGKWAERGVDRIHRMDPTLRTFLGGLAKYMIFAISLITVLAQFGVQTASLIAVLGAAGLALGLALQGTLSNVASGVMLLMLRPFNVGDYIVFGSNIGGTVKTLGLFVTELATADNVYIFVPNGQIWNSQITNYSRNLHRRQDFTVSIGYDDDMDKAIKTLQALAGKEERLIRTEGKEPQVVVGKLSQYSVDLIFRVWSLNSDYWQLQWDMTKAIKEEFDARGISIPFPTSFQYTVDLPADRKSKAA